MSTSNLNSSGVPTANEEDDEEEEDDDLFEDAAENPPPADEEEIGEQQQEQREREDDEEEDEDVEMADAEGEGANISASNDNDNNNNNEVVPEDTSSKEPADQEKPNATEENPSTTLNDNGEDNELLEQLENTMQEDEEQEKQKTPLDDQENKIRSFKQQHPIFPAQRMIDCSSYDIVPNVACLHASPVYCVDFSWGLKWMFTGGADGFIRKYNFFESVNNKLPLTVAQRHPFVDSITKSGVCVSYWENEQPTYEKNAHKVKDGYYEPKISPVYSIAVQSEALWLLAGLESGGITLQSIRHNEGQINAYLNKHTSAVSVLKLDDDETKVLSGSWDKTIVEWDLNNGKPFREFIGSSGQIAAIEWQPVGGSLVANSLRSQTPTTLSSNKNNGASNTNDSYNNGTDKNDDKDNNNNNINNKTNNEDEDEDDRKSLGSLFGDEEEEEQQQLQLQHYSENGNDKESEPAEIKQEEADVTQDELNTNNNNTNETTSHTEHVGTVQSHQSVFLSASIDGTVDIWDRRQEKKAGHLYVPNGVPPWCTSACWSADGNYIFVGRRNSTVDEFDIRSSLVTQARKFKFPSVSGAVSTVRAMPSGRHLLCGSHDNVRLYDLQASSKSSTPFYIIPGHHGAVLSSIYIDPSCQYMVTTSGNRGWQGNSTDVALIYEIEPQN